MCQFTPYYDPRMGRFVTEDSYRGSVDDPLSLNLYTYCGNDPVNLFDPSGHIPTPVEAAAMAKHIYNATINEIGKEVSGEWKLEDIKTNDEGLVMGVYSRAKVDGTIEYAVVNKGTSTGGDWGNNIQQPIGFSDDIKDSISKSSDFVNDDKYKDSEITMIGHSKGGAEAMANAIANNKNCITFNPAKPNLNAYKLSEHGYTASILNYIVRDEILNNTFGESSVGTEIYLPTQHKIEWWYPEQYKIYKRILNHYMEAVINALQEEEDK